MQDTIQISSIVKPFFVWFEDNWVHDNVLHHHEKAQLVYVESGFQYLTVEDSIYLLPQNHAAWIPSNALHKTNSHSEKIRLMVLFFNTEALTDPFYRNIRVFSVPPVLREMIKYAEKWSKHTEETNEENQFLGALISELPYFVAQALQLYIPVPADSRLRAITDHILDQYSSDIRIEQLSELAPVSLRSLERIFKKETGLTLNKYLQMVRIIKSLELLSTNEFTVSEIAFKVGYNSLQAYTNSFQSVMKQRPTDFLKTI